MKVLLAFLLEISAILFVSSTSPSNTEQFNFFALLHITSENQTKTCSAVVISENNVIAASHCAYFNKSVEQNVTYHVCFNPDKLVDQVNDVDCRTATILYQPKKKSYKGENSDISLVEIDNIAFFELSLGNEFDLGNKIKLPLVDPSQKVSELQDVTGLVLAYKDSQIIEDLYEVQPQSGINDTNSPAKKHIFYANSINETNNQLYKQTLLDCGAVFVVFADDEIYLMGTIREDDETPQSFAFVPNSFEEVATEETNNDSTETIRSKRAVGGSLTRSERYSKMREKFKKSDFVQGVKNMFGMFSAMLPSMMNKT